MSDIRVYVWAGICYLYCIKQQDWLVVSAIQNNLFSVWPLPYTKIKYTHPLLILFTVKSASVVWMGQLSGGVSNLFNSSTGKLNSFDTPT